MPPNSPIQPRPSKPNLTFQHRIGGHRVPPSTSDTIVSGRRVELLLWGSGGCERATVSVQAKKVSQHRNRRTDETMAAGRERMALLRDVPAPARDPSAKAAPSVQGSRPLPTWMRLSGTPNPFLSSPIMYGTLHIKVSPLVVYRRRCFMSC
jgi:hypothetical protein